MKDSSSIPVITIDGPSGVGKGTVGRHLAKTLHWHFLDSGCLYRALGIACLQENISPHDADALANLAKNLNLQFRDEEIYLNDHEITKQLREEKIGTIASQISSHPEVRTALLAKQWQMRQAPGLIADGRDMGTVIFPDAVLKIFLTASGEERARRRYLQLQIQNQPANYEEILSEVKKRDARDENREIAPLRPAPDAVMIDTTSLTREEVIQLIERLVKHALSS